MRAADKVQTKNTSHTRTSAHMEPLVHTHTHTQPAMQGNLHLLQKANKIESSRAGEQEAEGRGEEKRGEGGSFWDDFWPDVEHRLTGGGLMLQAPPAFRSERNLAAQTSFSLAIKAAGSFGSLTPC